MRIATKQSVPFCAYEFLSERLEVVGSKLASLSPTVLNTYHPRRPPHRHRISRRTLLPRRQHLPCRRRLKNSALHPSHLGDALVSRYLNSAAASSETLFRKCRPCAWFGG